MFHTLPFGCFFQVFHECPGACLEPCPPGTARLSIGAHASSYLHPSFRMGKAGSVLMFSGGCSTTLDKKRTIPEICGEKNAVPSSDIMLDDARSAQLGQKSRMTLPCTVRSLSSMITRSNSVLLTANLGAGSFFFSFCPGSDSSHRNSISTPLSYAYA